jgi:hypothetical protein
MKLYEPLYSADVGLCGFVCRSRGNMYHGECIAISLVNGGKRTDWACNKLCKSKQGMLLHLWRVHGLKEQADLFPTEHIQLDSRAAQGGANEEGQEGGDTLPPAA